MKIVVYLTCMQYQDIGLYNRKLNQDVKIEE
jgi:hypothetical protein